MLKQFINITGKIGKKYPNLKYRKKFQQKCNKFYK